MCDVSNPDCLCLRPQVEFLISLLGFNPHDVPMAFGDEEIYQSSIGETFFASDLHELPIATLRDVVAFSAYNGASPDNLPSPPPPPRPTPTRVERPPPSQNTCIPSSTQVGSTIEKLVR